MPLAVLSFDAGESSLSVRSFRIEDGISRPFAVTVMDQRRRRSRRSRSPGPARPERPEVAVVMDPGKATDTLVLEWPDALTAHLPRDLALRLDLGARGVVIAWADAPVQDGRRRFVFDGVLMVDPDTKEDIGVFAGKDGNLVLLRSPAGKKSFTRITDAVRVDKMAFAGWVNWKVDKSAASTITGGVLQAVKPQWCW